MTDTPTPTAQPKTGSSTFRGIRGGVIHVSCPSCGMAGTIDPAGTESVEVPNNCPNCGHRGLSISMGMKP